jgi:hypothetical protein
MRVMPCDVEISYDDGKLMFVSLVSLNEIFPPNHINSREEFI